MKLCKTKDDYYLFEENKVWHIRDGKVVSQYVFELPKSKRDFIKFAKKRGFTKEKCK